MGSVYEQVPLRYFLKQCNWTNSMKCIKGMRGGLCKNSCFNEFTEHQILSNSKMWQIELEHEATADMYSALSDIVYFKIQTH